MLFIWLSFTHTEMMPTGAGGVWVNVLVEWLMQFIPESGLWLKKPWKELIILVETRGLLDWHTHPEFEMENSKRYNYSYDKRWKHLNFLHRPFNLHWLVKIRKYIGYLHWLGLWDMLRLKIGLNQKVNSFTEKINFFSDCIMIKQCWMQCCWWVKSYWIWT